MISLPTGSVRHGQWTEVHHRHCHWGECPLRQSETASALFLPVMFVFDWISSLLQLNAFDSRHLDEIHFDVRLMAFQKATKHIKEMSTLDMRYLTVVMHNCFHSLEVTVKFWDSIDVTISIEDLFLCVSFCLALLWVLNAFCVSETDRWHVSGRQCHHVFVSHNNASLRNRMPRGRIQGDCAVRDTGCTAKGFEEQDWGENERRVSLHSLQPVLCEHSTFISHICISFSQSVRNEYTTVLACLVKTFPNRSEFRDLVQLTDYNDLESDFFEHMKHIQVTSGLFIKTHQLDSKPETS